MANEDASGDFKPRQPSNAWKKDLWKTAGVVAGLAFISYLLYFYFRTLGFEGIARFFEALLVAFTAGCVTILGNDYNARKRMEQDRQELKDQFAQYRHQVEQDRTRLNEEFIRYREQAELELHHLADEFNRYQERIATNVFDAVLGRIVPAEVFHEINDILHSEIVRRDCKYRIIFKEPYPGMAKDHFVIRREVRYIVENRLSRETIFAVRSTHSEDVDLAAAGWTGRDLHLALLVDDQPVELKHGVNLLVEAERNFSRLVHQITLGPRESRSITLHGEEPCLISAGRNTYLHATPVLGIEVEIWNDYKEMIGTSGVQMNHPAAGEAKRDGIGRYVLERAFLPGQGFQVTWKEIGRETTDAR